MCSRHPSDPHAEARTRHGLDSELAAELSGEALREFQTQRRPAVQVEIIRQTDAVIADRQLTNTSFCVIRTDADRHCAVAPVRKPMLETVRHQLVDQQTERNRNIQAYVQRCDHAVQANATRRRVMRFGESAD